MERVWPLLAIYAVFDCFQYIASGGIRAAGKQGLAALVTWLSYCLVAVLASWLSAFKFEKGLMGVWIGPTLALALNSLLYVLIWLQLDWESLISEAALQRAHDKAN